MEEKIVLKKKNIVTASALLALGLGAVSTATSSKTADAASTTIRTIMSKSVVYNKKGKSTGKKIATYKNVTVYGNKIKINGKKYYKIGTNKYVKAVNIDGTTRTLYHNAYIYTNKGKRIKYSLKLMSGTTRQTYGKLANIKGKKMYRIGKNQYVKLANFNYTPKATSTKTTSSADSNFTEVSPGVYVEDSSPVRTLNASEVQKVRDEFLQFVNNWREKQGLKPFTTTSWLNQGAQTRADEEISVFNKTGDISHIRPNGSRFWTAFSNQNQMKGEVIGHYSYYTAENTGKGSHVADVMINHDEGANWGHRENLRQNLKKPGIGIGVSSVVDSEGIGHYIFIADIADLA